MRREPSANHPIHKQLDGGGWGSPSVGREYLAVRIAHEDQISVDLLKNSRQSVMWNRRIEGKYSRWVRQTISKIVDKAKTSCKFKLGDSSNVGVIFIVKFDAKEVLE
jgi:hypothetical protein